MPNYLEHANITVKDPDESAALLCRLFGWKVRWQGKSLTVGKSVHVGGEQSYIAFYTQPGVTESAVDTYKTANSTNHIGVVVEDIEEIEAKVVAEGLRPTNHGDYEPGLRFYFDTPDGLEIEVVNYPQG